MHFTMYFFRLFQLSEVWDLIIRKVVRLFIYSRSVNIYIYIFWYSGSIPGTMYGLVKTHKVEYPVQPIVSAIKTFSYNLCKFLVPIFAPFTCNQFTISNSANFLGELKSAHIVGPTVMAIVSMFNRCILMYLLRKLIRLL